MNKTDDVNVLDSSKQELLKLVQSQFKDLKHGRFQPPEFRSMVSLDRKIGNTTIGDLIADDSSL